LVETNFLTYSISFSFRVFPCPRCFFDSLSPSVSLQSHKRWSTVSLILQKGHSLLSCFFMIYPCVAVVLYVRNLEITTWSCSRLFTFFVSLFHSISFFIFFILFSLFCHLVFLVYLSSVLSQFIRSCGGYSSEDKSSDELLGVRGGSIEYLVKIFLVHRTPC
jgi:hypothetical protein